jgi:uncharacterized protein (TIGR03086 family)
LSPARPGTTALLERAFASTRGVVAGISPEDLHRPTPCSGWDVRTLVNHTIGGSYWYAEAMRDRVSPPIDGDDDDYAAADLLGAYDQGIGLALAAFGATGALEADVDFVGAIVPGAIVMGLAATDTFTHGWDLAVATDQPRDLDPALAEELLVLADRILPGTLRGTTDADLFRPALDAPPGALAADRLAAFLGRLTPSVE